MESLLWGLGLMSAMAIYQQLHHKKRKTFHSPNTTEAVEKVQEKQDLLCVSLWLTS